MTQPQQRIISVVTVEEKEQLSGTEARVFCKVRGLTKALGAVTWTKSDGSLITSGQEGLTVDTGIFSGSSQTTTLTVAGPQNNQDTTYNCVVTSNELGFKEETTAVNLHVFSKFIWYSIALNYHDKLTGKNMTQ